MTVYYADPQGDANVPMKTRLVSGEHVPAHDVQSLPGTVETDINTSSGFLSSLVTLMTTLAGSVTAGRVAIDVSTTIATYLANLPNLATSTQLPTTIGTKAKASALATSIATDDPAFYETAVSGTLTSIGTVVAPMTGRRTAGVYVPTSSTLVATLVAEYTIIGAGGWEATNFVDPFTGASSATLVTASGVSAARILYVPPGAVSVRVRPSAFTSGTGTVYVTAGNSDASLVKLDTIATNQGVPTGGPKFGQNSSIGTGTDAQFTSQALSHGMTVTNFDAAATLYVSHAATPTSTGSTTYRVAPFGSTPFIECSNANLVYMRSSTGTIAAGYVGA